MEENLSKSCMTYSFFIHPNDYRELRRDIWCDEPVPAKLKVGRKTYEVNLAYRGAHTRNLSRKSYRVECIHPSSLFGAQEFHLNAEYMDPSMMRNTLSFDFFRTIGVHAPETKHVLIVINGTLQGLYLHIESVDASFLQKRELSSGAIYYASNDSANFSLLRPEQDEVKQSLDEGYERKCGDESSDRWLQSMLYIINTAKRNDFTIQINRYLDVQAYLRWLVGVVCTQNFDGFIQNYALYLSNQTRQFRMIPWDYDATWGRNINGKAMDYDYVPITGYNTLTARLLDVPEFRAQYRNYLERVLEHEFSCERLEPKIEAIHRTIRPYFEKDPVRKQKIQEFDHEPAYISDFIRNRRAFLLDSLHAL